MWYQNKDVLKAIVVVLLAVLACVYLVYKGKLSKVKEVALELVNQAEKEFGGGTGDIKYIYVVGLLYPRLPLVVKLFISEKTLDKIIELAVTEMKELLKSDDNTAKQ